MSSGERPIGAAKGEQSDTEALCHPPPPCIWSGQQLFATDTFGLSKCSEFNRRIDTERHSPLPPLPGPPLPSHTAGAAAQNHNEASVPPFGFHCLPLPDSAALLARHAACSPTCPVILEHPTPEESLC